MAWPPSRSSPYPPGCRVQGAGRGAAIINQQADASFQQADAALNRVYQQIRRQYRDQPRFLDKLKAAQLAWIRFRDAELQARYPPTADGDPSISDGSMYPTCIASAMERLTRERTAQ